MRPNFGRGQRIVGTTKFPRNARRQKILPLAGRDRKKRVLGKLFRVESSNERKDGKKGVGKFKPAVGRRRPQQSRRLKDKKSKDRKRYYTYKARNQRGRAE